MANKITHAPVEVIKELDILVEKAEYEPRYFLVDITEANEHGKAYPIGSICEWYNEIYRKTGERTHVEKALLAHLFFDEKLQPEREPHWYVGAKDGEGNNVNYFYDGVGNIYPYTHTRPSYDFGITKEKADLIAKATGGEAKEIK